MVVFSFYPYNIIIKGDKKKIQKRNSSSVKLFGFVNSPSLPFFNSEYFCGGSEFYGGLLNSPINL